MKAKVLPSHMELIHGTWLNVRTSPTPLVSTKVVKNRATEAGNLFRCNGCCQYGNVLLPAFLWCLLANSFFIIQLFVLFSGIYCICNWNIFLQNDETWKGNFWINHVLIAYISLVQSSPPSLDGPWNVGAGGREKQMKKLISCKWRSNNWNQPNSLIWYFGINLFVFPALNVNSSQKAQQFNLQHIFASSPNAQLTKPNREALRIQISH